MEERRRQGFYYGWIVVVASFLTMFIFFSIQYVFGVFSKSLLDEFG